MYKHILIWVRDVKERYYGNSLAYNNYLCEFPCFNVVAVVVLFVLHILLYLNVIIIIKKSRKKMWNGKSIIIITQKNTCKVWRLTNTVHISCEDAEERICAAKPHGSQVQVLTIPLLPRFLTDNRSRYKYFSSVCTYLRLPARKFQTTCKGCFFKVLFFVVKLGIFWNRK